MFGFVRRGRDASLSVLFPSKKPKPVADVAQILALVPVADRQRAFDAIAAQRDQKDAEALKTAANGLLPSTTSTKEVAAVLAGPASLISATLDSMRKTALEARDAAGMQLIGEAITKHKGNEAVRRSAPSPTATAIAAILAGPDALVDGALLTLRADALAARDATALELVGRVLVSHRAQVLARLAAKSERLRAEKAKAAAAREAEIRARVRRAERIEGARG